MLDIFHFSFFQNALFASFLVSITCGMIAPWIMVNRMSFITGGIAHASYGGVGLAIFLGFPVLPVSVVFCGVLALAISFAMEKQNSRLENLIGMVWVAGMAFGIFMISASQQYVPDISQYLFGSILSISLGMNIYFAIFNLILIVFFYYTYEQYYILSFDEEYAKSRGINASLLKTLLLLVVAESVVIIMQLVGLMLVVAILTIPPLISEIYSNKMPFIMILSFIWCFLACICGLFISSIYNVSIGASTVLTLCLVWVVLVFFRYQICTLNAFKKMLK